MKNVQIPESLFIELYKYFLLDIQNPEITENIKKQLNEKFDLMVKRNLYFKYLQAQTEQDKIEALEKYIKGKKRS